MPYPDEYTNFSFQTECPSAMDYEQEINNLIVQNEEHDERIEYIEVNAELSNKTWKVFI